MDDVKYLGRANMSTADETKELPKLAQSKFGSLNEAEEKLFWAVAKGEIADYRVKSGEENDPANADKWSESRVLKASRLEWLCTDAHAIALVTRFGIAVVGARVEGELDLSFSKILFPLKLDRCAFQSKINTPYAQMCLLSLEGSHTRAIIADGLKVEGSLFLRDGFKAEGEVRLHTATIAGNLECEGAHFAQSDARALIADGLKVEGSVLLRKGFMAEGEVRLLGGTIGGNLDCNGGLFINTKAKALSADALRVQGSAFLGNGFKAKGEVSLRGATIGGSLYCDGGEFANGNGKAFSADRLKVHGSVTLRKGFKAEGEVRFLGAAIGGNLSCIGGCFINQGARVLSGDGMKVEGNVFLREGFETRGEVFLNGAMIGGDIDCLDGQFINPNARALSADGVKIGGGVFLRKGFKAEGEVSLVSAEIGRYLLWTEINPTSSVSLNLSSAKVGTLLDDEASWPRKGRLILDGFDYGAIDAHAPANADNRIKWLQRQPDRVFHPQPYEHLAEVFRRKGQDEDAVKVLIAKNKERARHSKPFRQGWWWYYLFGRLIGYGYRPWRAFWASAAIVFIGALVFGQNYPNLITPTKKEAYASVENAGFHRLSDDYPTFNALLYSLETFTPLLSLSQKEYWMPNANHGDLIKWRSFTMRTGGLLRFYLWFHIIAGWTLTTLWVGGLTGLIKT